MTKDWKPDFYKPFFAKVSRSPVTFKLVRGSGDQFLFLQWEGNQNTMRQIQAVLYP